MEDGRRREKGCKKIDCLPRSYRHDFTEVPRHPGPPNYLGRISNYFAMKLAAPEPGRQGQKKPRNRKGTRTRLLAFFAHGVLQLLLVHGNLFVLFTFLVWYKYSTQEIIRNDFLFLFRKEEKKLGSGCVWGD